VLFKVTTTRATKESNKRKKENTLTHLLIDSRDDESKVRAVTNTNVHFLACSIVYSGRVYTFKSAHYHFTVTFRLAGHYMGQLI
jgi:hypothetical protein